MNPDLPPRGLVSYRQANRWRAGVLVDGHVVDAARAAAAGGGSAPPEAWATVRTILGHGNVERPELWDGARELAARGQTVDAPRLGPPVPDPPKILCVGLNYRAHVSEVGMDEPGDPVLFPKFANALIGPGATIPLPAASDEVDYEGELAIVIGRRCRHVPPESALDVVAGYMPFNDVSARDIQMRVSQWTAGKAIDGFGPAGPALVPASDVADPQQLVVRTTVNGRVLQEASTAFMIYPIARVIAFVTSLMTLEPGDVIATGTPEGVGFTRDPPVFLRDGDEVVVEVDGLGRLRNPVAADR